MRWIARSASRTPPNFSASASPPAELDELNRPHPNITVVKAESTAVGVGRVIEQLGGRMKVFNGRAGLELTDNYRAGVDGMIPGIETIDLQVAIERAMRAGDEAQRRGALPQAAARVGLHHAGRSSHFVLYGKLHRRACGSASAERTTALTLRRPHPTGLGLGPALRRRARSLPA